MRKSILAALLCSTAIAFPIQAIPIVVPGSGYTAIQRSNLTLPGKTSLVALARPEYSSYAQVGLTTDASYTPAQAAPNGHLLTPLVSGMPYFSDYLVTFTGFAQAEDGTIREGCTARVTVNGSDPVILHAGEIDIPLDVCRGGSRKIDGFSFWLKWDSVSADLQLRREVNIELLPTPAQQAAGMVGRLITFFMTCKHDYDVKAVIDPSITGTGPTTFSGVQGQAFKSYGTFMQAVNADLAVNPTRDHYATLVGSVSAATFDVATFGVNAMTNTASANRTGRTVIDGAGLKAKIANTAAPGTYVDFRPRFNGLDIRGFEIDMEFIGGLSVALGDGYTTLTRLQRCDVHGGPRGRYEVSAVDLRGCPSMVGNTTCLAAEQTYFHDMARGDNTITAMVGTFQQRVGGDLHNIASGQPHTFVCADKDDVGDPYLNVPTAALDIAYTGSGAATYGISGTIQTTSRTLTLYVDGVSKWSKPASLTKNSGVFSLDDLIADINVNAAGFTVTKNANYDNLPQLGYSCLAYPSEDYATATTGNDCSATGTGIILGRGFRFGRPVHTDYMQPTSVAVYDNNLHLSYLATNSFASTLAYLGTLAGGGHANTAILNVGLDNSLDYSFQPNTQGQIAAQQIHLMIAHLSQPSAILALRFSGGSPNLTMDKFSSVGKIYCEEFNLPGISTTTMQGYIQDVISTRQISANPALPFTATGVVSLGYSGRPDAFQFDIYTYPQLAFGKAIAATGKVPARFAASDYKPASGSLLWQHLVKPWLRRDALGNPYNYGGADLVGCVGLASATT